MTNREWAKLIVLATKDLEEVVNVYEKAAAASSTGYVYAGYEVPKHHSKETIKRRITQIRHDLLMLEKGLFER